MVLTRTSCHACASAPQVSTPCRTPDGGGAALWQHAPPPGAHKPLPVCLCAHSFAKTSDGWTGDSQRSMGAQCMATRRELMSVVLASAVLLRCCALGRLAADGSAVCAQHTVRRCRQARTSVPRHAAMLRRTDESAARPKSQSNGDWSSPGLSAPVDDAAPRQHPRMLTRSALQLPCAVLWVTAPPPCSQVLKDEERGEDPGAGRRERAAGRARGQRGV
jgi:hypothetical protein